MVNTVRYGSYRKDFAKLDTLTVVLQYICSPLLRGRR